MKRIGRWVQGMDFSAVVPDRIRKRHARKFFMGVLVVMLVAGLVGAVSYAQTQQRLETQVQNRLVSTAELQADGLDSWITGLSRQTRTLSQAKQFQNGDVSAIDLYLMSQRPSESEAIAAVHYVNVSSGEILASTNRTVVNRTAEGLGATWAGKEVDATTDETSTVHVASQPYRSPVADAPVVAFVSAPPSNTAHAVVVVASLETRVNDFHQTTAGGYTRIVNASGGTVLASRANASDPGISPTALYGETRNSTAGFATGSSAVVGYAPVEHADWAVLTYAPKSSAYSIRDSVGTSLGATVLATLAVLGVSAIWFGRRQTRTLEDLTAKAERMEAGNLDAELETERIDEFGRLYGAFDSMRRSLREKIERTEHARAEAESAREKAEDAREAVERERREAEQARAEAEELSASLEATAEEYRDVMAACAEGDLTARMDGDDRSEAMADIAGAFNEMVAEWEATLRSVREFGRTVADESEVVSDTVAEVSATGEDVSESVAQISEGAADQSDHLQSVVGEMNDLTATVEEVSTAADDAAVRAERVASRGQDGREATASVVRELDEIEAQTQQTVESVEQLHALVADIEDVTEFITDIAEQTHVLALNASIEAARAGDAGSGFAVVAEEVKALADQTQDATDDIESSIDRVRDQTDETMAGIRETRRKVAEGTETVAEAVEAFEAVVDGVAETDDDLQEMSAATERQAESARSVVAMVEEVSAISEETTAEAQTVAAAAERQTDALGEATEGVAELADRADELTDLLDSFETASAETEVEADHSEPSADAGTDATETDATDEPDDLLATPP